MEILSIIVVRGQRRPQKGTKGGGTTGNLYAWIASSFLYADDPICTAGVDDGRVYISV